jgi:hypothetical protein
MEVEHVEEKKWRHEIREVDDIQLSESGCQLVFAGLYSRSTDHGIDISSSVSSTLTETSEGDYTR